MFVLFASAFLNDDTKEREVCSEYSMKGTDVLMNGKIYSINHTIDA